VSPRPYRLGRRSETIEQTRQRILAATRELLAREDYQQMSLDEVARAADVARATVYYQFGSKAGLLEAVVRHIQQRAGQSAVVDATVLRDPLDALRQAFLAGCRFWAAEHRLVQRLSGLAAVDAEVRRVLVDVQQDRLPLVTGLVQRLDAAGRLSPDYPEPKAVDVLWLLSSFEAFDQLYTGRGMAAEEVAEALADLAVRALIRGEDEEGS
jgi:AcrR family transcriptional regulator